MPSRTRSDSDDVPQDDVEMADASVEGTVEEQPQNVEDPRIKTLAGATEDAASYEFTNEDHTLGNALRWMIMKNPEVEFCGYSIPHPSEPKLNIRIQTHKPYTPRQALAQGLEDLVGLCDVVEDKFIGAKEVLMSREASVMET